MNNTDECVRDIFDRALEIPDPSDRRQWVERNCGDFPHVQQQVLSLLLSFDRAADSEFLDEAASISHSPESPEESIGDVVGPYALLERIGEGGMGIVFAAEQTTPFRRTVALKLNKIWADTALNRRFETESQALASLNHPHIAKVYDAGMTESGFSYVAMELIDGMPVTEYCATNQLSLRESLQLFVDIGHAVQHAHEQGLVHGDLKPTNILVESVNGRPIPRIIDFGAARRTDGSALQTAGNSSLTAVVGTPRYMSPEQASGNSEIDIRTDVYSLGVLLYEILTGQTPGDRETLSTRAAVTCRKRVSSETQPNPNKTFPRRKLSRDLDGIATKSLAPARNDRYATVGELVEDIERVLENKPVAALPPSAVDSATKFVRRNRGALVTTVLAVAVVVASMAGFFGFWRNSSESSVAEQPPLHGSSVKENSTWIVKRRPVPVIRGGLALRPAAVRDAHVGWSVAIEGDYAVIGAPFDEDTATRCGTVRIFKRDPNGPASKLGETWRLWQTLEGRVGEKFGYSVSIQGNTIIVGATFADGHRGAAYVFERAAGSQLWGQPIKLSLSESTPRDYFGTAVAVDGDVAVVTAPFDDFNGRHSGSVYVFHRIQGEWSRVKTHRGLKDDRFGRSVSLSGDTIAVGAPGAPFDEQPRLISTGAAFLYERNSGGENNWGRTHRVTAKQAGRVGFGASISLDHDTLAVGASTDLVNGQTAGSVYLYERRPSRLVRTSIIYAPDFVVNDAFGCSVSVAGESLVIGSCHNNAVASRSGAAYLYQRVGSKWRFEHKVAGSNTNAGDQFGSVVRTDGKTILIGAGYESTNTKRHTGAVYVFRSQDAIPLVAQATGNRRKLTHRQGFD